MNLAELTVDLDLDKVAQFCAARGIRQLSLFGSVLRDDFVAASDLDMLVEYSPGRHPGLMLFRQQDELSAMLGRPVDLHTPASLSRYFRAEVLASALPLYEQA